MHWHHDGGNFFVYIQGIKLSIPSSRPFCYNLSLVQLAGATVLFYVALIAHLDFMEAPGSSYKTPKVQCGVSYETALRLLEQHKASIVPGT